MSADVSTKRLPVGETLSCSGFAFEYVARGASRFDDGVIAAG